MDTNKFTDDAPGRLIQIPHPAQPSKSDWSFVPNMLPPKWELSPSLWPLIAEASAALGTLDGIGQTIPNPELLLRPLQAREAISSSRIEGTYVTPQQLMLFGLDKDRQPSSGKEAEWAEVFNYGEALRIGHNRVQKLPICHRVIREMHEILMSGSHNKDAAPGLYRKLQVQIGHSGRFIPPPTSHVEQLMDDFEEFVNATDGSYHPLVRAFIAHYQFEAIHPFQDGNGRIGRALLALTISEWMGHSMPWLYLSAFFDKYKDEYINGLFKVSTHGAWTEWIEFCLRGTIVQAMDSIMRCRGFNQLKREFHESVDSTPRTYSIIEGLFTTPVLTIASVASEQEVCYQTAHKDVLRLQAAGIVEEIPNVYPKSFVSQKIMDIAFSDSYSQDNAPQRAEAVPAMSAAADQEEMPF